MIQWGCMMKLQRLLLVLGVFLGLAGVAFLAKDAEPGTGTRLATAGQAFVETLTPEQKTKAVFDFDDKERTNWNFVPLQDKDRKSTRKGLPLEEMTEKQKEAARALVKAGTSPTGFTKAETIMSLETMLHDLEKSGAMVRNPGWYFFSVFGEPSKTGKWGFRVEGHHLSLNFTLDRGQVAAFTPCFFGANPATVQQGDRKGLRVLAEVEDLAQELFNALDADQKAIAFQEKQFPEIEQKVTVPGVGAPVGLPAAKLNEKQKGILLKLLHSYTDRVAADVAAAEFARIEKAGIDKIHFAFAREDDKPGKPYTYRLQGPTFVVEFLNVQPDSAKNPANHIHSGMRELKGDFGLTK
jgi:Protein of unknown function (DUF3500)